MANGLLDNEQRTVTMRARKRRVLQKCKTKSLVAEPGLRLDAVDLGEESPDNIFSHNFTIAMKWKSLN